MTDTQSLLQRADLARREQRLDDARAAYAAAVASLRGGVPTKDLVRALRGFAEVERDLGHPDPALALYEQAVDVCRDLGDGFLLAHTVRHLGDLHRGAGRLERAEPCYEEALVLYRAGKAPPALDLANAIRPLAILKARTHRAEEARHLLEEARDLYAAAGVDAGVEECTNRLRGLKSDPSPPASN